MNILILTGKFGMGHYSAATALAEELEKGMERPSVYVEDLFVCALKGRCRLLYRYFSFVVQRGNWLYNLVYRRTEHVEKKGMIPLKRSFLRALDRLVRETGASVVISTLPICSQLISEYKQETGSKVRLVTCITDVTTHSEWLYPHTDLYLAPAPAIRDSLLHKGVPPERIAVSGIPVRGQFHQWEARAPSEKKRVLIMGGGFGLLPKSAEFYAALSGLEDLEVTVITGKNKALFEKLRRNYPNLTVLGYADDVSRYMKQADLIVSKPGGVTLFESIHTRTPLLMFPPFLEQEMRNGDFVLRNRLGLVLPRRPERFAGEIGRTANDGVQLSVIRQNMARFEACLDSGALLRTLHAYEEAEAPV